MIKICCTIIALAFLSTELPAQDPKPVVNPTTGTRMPDTTNYKAFRGQRRFAKNKVKVTKTQQVAPMRKDSSYFK